MGTSRVLYKSVHYGAVFVLGLHRAFATAMQEVNSIKCYPVMDGLYITTPSQNDLRLAVKIAFREMALEFINREGTKNMFMMRAGLAYGPVIHGADIPWDALESGDKLEETKNRVLLSPAMVSAYRAESKAPPFGIIYVDDTAKTFPGLSEPEDHGFYSNLYQWWVDDDEATIIAKRLYEQIKFYLQKAEVRSVGMGYERDRIQAHKNLAEEYFGGLMH